MAIISVPPLPPPVGVRHLRDTVAEGPILRSAGADDDHHVLGSKARRLRHEIDKQAIERRLHFGRSGPADGDRDIDEIAGARAGEIATVKDQLVLVVLVDGLEAIVFRHVEGLD
ncbi:hypothetical protein GGE46_002861 [Rhizobium etli]|uniref:Uncharacterized protein n=1 Tax=Rhizobium etli TaxID=29449 RepID=A0A7W6ZIA1_RHIET|nr:hypothetical protein [Rhizobium etli]MBB4536172.1 hypothetical protein [Rhizobium etli]